MPKRSKRYQELAKLIDKDKTYSLDEALEIINKFPKRKNDGGVELHLRLGIDPKKSDQTAKVSVILPSGAPKEKKLIAFVLPENEEKAQKAGADLIGNENTIKEIKKSEKLNFEIAIAEPGMMKNLGPIAKVLGTKGLMPNPKLGTVGPNIEGIIKDVKGGKVSFRNDESGNIHVLVGRMSWDADKVKANVEATIEELKRNKPESLKGTYIKGATLAASMSPGIRIAVS